MHFDDLRIGQGIDIHAFCEGRPLIIGGVHIPSSRGLAGHSDADVLLHAVIDALLGAAGKGDIGVYFPDTDMQWRGADSMDLLRRVWADLSSAGWRVLNLDATVLLEEPKLRPHAAAMQKNIAGVLGVSPECCNIKATTAETLGFVGRKEGILASCAALLCRRATGPREGDLLLV